jgi:uncharacterized membrane protein
MSQVVGEAFGCETTSHAFLWENGGPAIDRTSRSSRLRPVSGSAIHQRSREIACLGVLPKRRRACGSLIASTATWLFSAGASVNADPFQCQRRRAQSLAQRHRRLGLEFPKRSNWSIRDRGGTNAKHSGTRVASFLALVALPAPAAQDHPAKHRHYTLVDIGTFGGPHSQVNFNSRVINSRGTVAGGAPTAVPDPLCTFDVLFCFYFHALTWQNGVTTDSGTLPGGNNSFAVAPMTTVGRWDF